MLPLPLSPVLSPLWLVTTFAYQMASNSLCSDFSEGSSKLDSFNMFGRLALLPSWSWWIISRRFRWQKRIWWLNRPSCLSLSQHYPYACRQVNRCSCVKSFNIHRCHGAIYPRLKKPYDFIAERFYKMYAPLCFILFDLLMTHCLEIGKGSTRGGDKVRG